MYLEQEAVFLTGEYKYNAWEIKNKVKKHWEKPRYPMIKRKYKLD